MGEADLGTIDMKDNSFRTKTSLKMEGHSVEIEISARFEGERVEGSLSLQNSPPLAFAGGRTD
jgi:hypothetical protein